MHVTRFIVTDNLEIFLIFWDKPSAPHSRCHNDLAGPHLGFKPGHSGYPIFSGRVIQNSGNENCYPILVSKKHYLQFWVPENLCSGSGIPDLHEFSKNNTLHKFLIAIYI